MTLPPKRQRSDDKIHEKIADSEELNYLSELNADCIYEILKYLNPQDLCAVSETCVRLKRLVNSHVRRKYGMDLPKSVQIDVDGRGEIVLQPNRIRGMDVDLKYFVGCIRVAYIRHVDNRYIANFIRFLKENWCGYLQKVIFDCQDYIQLIDWQQLELTLADVEILELNYVSKRYKNLNELLKFCPKLEILRAGQAWLPSADELGNYTQCVNLHTVECRVSQSFSVEHLQLFLQQNSNVSKLVCSFAYEPFKSWKDKLIVIVDVIARAESVFELYLKIAAPMAGRSGRGVSVDWPTVYKQLKTLDAKESFRRCEIFVENTNRWINQVDVTNVPHSLTGIHLSFNTLSEFHTASLIGNAFSELNTLKLDLQTWHIASGNIASICKCASQNLIKLEQVHLVVSEMNDGYFEFVAQSSMLQKLVLRLHRMAFNEVLEFYLNVENRMNTLNEMRKNLDNATQMNIYICEEYDSARSKELLTKPDKHIEGDLVALRTIRLWRELPHKENPLLPTLQNISATLD